MARVVKEEWGGFVERRDIKINVGGDREVG